MTIELDLTTAHELAKGLDPVRVGRVLQSIHDARGGYPARASGTEGGGGGLIDDDGYPYRNTAVEASVIEPPVDVAALDYRTLERKARRLLSELQAVTDIANRYAPLTLVADSSRPADPDDDVGTIWCEHCYTNNRHLEPVGTRPDGTVYYKRLCRACGQWRGIHGKLPPPAILKKRHKGERLTVQFVEKAMLTPKRNKR